MTKEELELRKALKQERLNRLYLERIYYTGECRRDLYAIVFSFVAAIVSGVGLSVNEEHMLKVLTAVGEGASIISLVTFIRSLIKNTKKQNAKENEHTALEGQNPEDIEVEDSYTQVLK